MVTIDPTTQKHVAFGAFAFAIFVYRVTCVLLKTK